MLEQSLTQQEEDEERRNQMTSQGSGAASKLGTAPKGGGKDAKEKAKAPAKGATPADDQNVPKNIDVEYEEIPEEPDYMIMEKSF